MSFTTRLAARRCREKQAYKDLQENRTGLFGIDKSLKPRYNLWDGTTEIINPHTKKREVYKQESGFFGVKYKRVK